MWGKREVEANAETSSAELKAPKDYKGKNVAQCAKAVSKAEKFQTLYAGLEASCALKDAELDRQAEQLSELTTFKILGKGGIKEQERHVEALAEEAAQAEVATKAFTLEQVLRGSLTLELAIRELDAMALLLSES